MIKRISLVLLFTISLNGCLYKIDIHQGNVVDQEQVDKLKPGMSKNQVISLLGSPQLTDPFHSQRWDYYSMSNVNNQNDKTESLLTLNFEGEQLVEIVK
jgi:outer membrane protein assembly factor BamE